MAFQEIDTYADLCSPLHRWDPRIKVFCLFLLLCAIVLQESPWFAGGGLCISLALIFLSQVPLPFLWKRARWAILFFFFLSLLFPLAVPGEQNFFALSFLSASHKGAMLALMTTLRGLSAVLIMLALLTTTRFDRIIKTLHFYRIPNKLVQVLLFAYRYLFLLAGENHRMNLAARLRASRDSLGISTLRKRGFMAAMLFVRALDRAERIHHAMGCRAYQGTLNTLSCFRFGDGDFLKGGFALVLVMAFIAVRFLF